MMIVYFSNVTEYTHRFVQKLNTPTLQRIPLKKTENELLVHEPFILIVPTYKSNERRAVPPQVIRFLNNPDNRKHLKGVIGTGNTNFNKDYCKAAKDISIKCGVPVLYRLELLGTPEDVHNVNTIIRRLTENHDNIH